MGTDSLLDLLYETSDFELSDVPKYVFKCVINSSYDGSGYNSVILGWSFIFSKTSWFSVTGVAFGLILIVVSVYSRPVSSGDFTVTTISLPDFGSEISP